MERRRFGREFELELCEAGFIIKKFWLSVSEDEQLARLKARESDPLKRFLKKEQDEKSAIEEIAENYKGCVDIWKKAKG